MSTISETRTALPTGTWQVDPVHSTVGFSVKHMVVANFRGGFDTFSVTLDETGLRGTVDVASIGVSEPNLNGHLLSPDFFDAERNPQLSFNSTAIRVEGDKLDIDGELTIKGTTKPVKITGTVSGPVTQPRRQDPPRPRAGDGRRPDGVRPRLERPASDRRLCRRQRRQARCRARAGPGGVGNEAPRHRGQPARGFVQSAAAAACGGEPRQTQMNDSPSAPASGSASRRRDEDVAPGPQLDRVAVDRERPEPEMQ